MVPLEAVMAEVGMGQISFLPLVKFSPLMLGNICSPRTLT